MLALRFNFEMMRTSRIAAAVADREDLAVARAKAALASEAAPVAPAQEGANAGSLDAVRDVIAWNTVWEINAVATAVDTGVRASVIQAVRILMDPTEKELSCPDP